MYYVDIETLGYVESERKQLFLLVSDLQNQTIEEKRFCTSKVI